MTERAVPVLRMALVAVYVALAHAASIQASYRLAACALVVLALLLLLGPLLARRGWAWLALAAVASVAAGLQASPLSMLPLLLVPPAFMGMAGWMFARTLRLGRVPLLTRLAAAVERIELAALPDDLRRYSRSLTGLWAGVLWLMALVNLLLALLARPGGLLVGIGVHAPWTVTPAQWSWLANAGIYGLIGGLLVGEYAWRWWWLPRWRLPPAEAARRVVALGPAFWRDFLR